MTLSERDLATFTSPFDDWQGEFLAVLARIESFEGDDDELLALLFNDLLQFVEHQFTTYDCLLPALPSLGALWKRRHEFGPSVMSFLAHVFRGPIRYETELLVDPVEYDYLNPRAMAPTAGEMALFGAARTFHAAHRHLLAGGAYPPHFDVTFLGRRQDAMPAAATDDATTTSWLLSAAMERYRSHGSLVLDTGIQLHDSDDRALVDAVQGRSSSDARLLALIEDDVQIAGQPWASGRLGAIAGLLLVAKTAPGSDDCVRAIEAVVERCSTLKALRAGDDETVICTDQFLLEDLSAMLFREHRGATRPVDPASLTRPQRVFLHQLDAIYRGHTHALLYSGIAPPGLSSEELQALPSIYQLD
jgi:hypothetical protein